MYEFERSVLTKEQLARKTGKDMGADVLGASGGEFHDVLRALAGLCYQGLSRDWHLHVAFPCARCQSRLYI